MAHVRVVIIGLTRRDQEPAVKRLFSYREANGDPTISEHAALTPYLFDAGMVNNRHLVVGETNRPLGSVPDVIIGSKPIDGGHYIFSADESRTSDIENECASSKASRSKASMCKRGAHSRRLPERDDLVGVCADDYLSR
jgi:hypothetical protein